MKKVFTWVILAIVIGCLVPNASAAWGLIGGHTLSAPAIAYQSDSDYTTEGHFLVIRGMDNHLYFSRYNETANSWTQWLSLGGTSYDEPTVAYTQDNTVHIVIRGTDNHLYYKKLNLTSGIWSHSWTSLGGTTSSAPTLLSSSSEDPEGASYLWLAIRGTDNNLYTKQWTQATGWATLWQRWGGTTYDRPSLVFLQSFAPGGSTLTMGVRGSDNKVYTRDYAIGFERTGFRGPWTLAGGSTLSPPVLCYKDGVLHIIIRGSDNHVYQKAGSNPYEALGGTTTDMPAAGMRAGVLMVWIRGMDNKVYQNNLMTSGWAGWYSYGGSTLNHPAWASGGWTVVWRGTDNGVYAQYY